MKLSDCNSKKLLPLFMRKDDFNTTICQCIDKMVIEIWEKILIKLRFWDYFDSMTEKQLDECADEFNIYWYRYTVNVEMKRSIVKKSREVKRKLGTVWAVEYVLSVYFPEAKVVEYWEYGGLKKHFKIQTWNTATVNKDAEDFLKILDKVKRKAAVLDYIEILEKSTNEILYVITPGVAEIIENTEIGGIM